MIRAIQLYRHSALVTFDWNDDATSGDVFRDQHNRYVLQDWCEEQDISCAIWGNDCASFITLEDAMLVYLRFK